MDCLNYRVDADLAIQPARHHDRQFALKGHPLLGIQVLRSELDDRRGDVGLVLNYHVTAPVIGQEARFEHQRQSKLLGCCPYCLRIRRIAERRDRDAMRGKVLLLCQLILNQPDGAR
jgi:hypothetical protein